MGWFDKKKNLKFKFPRKWDDLTRKKGTWNSSSIENVMIWQEKIKTLKKTAVAVVGEFSGEISRNDFIFKNPIPREGKVPGTWKLYQMDRLIMLLSKGLHTRVHIGSGSEATAWKDLSCIFVRWLLALITTDLTCKKLYYNKYLLFFKFQLSES